MMQVYGHDLIKLNSFNWSNDVENWNMPKCICFSICLFFRSIFHMFFSSRYFIRFDGFLAIFRWLFFHLRFPVINIFHTVGFFLFGFSSSLQWEHCSICVAWHLHDLSVCHILYVCLCAAWHKTARYSSEYIFFSLFLFVLNWINYVVWIFNHVLFESVIILFIGKWNSLVAMGRHAFELKCAGS